MKNARKYLKVIAPLAMSLCITSTLFIQPAMADSAASTVNTTINPDVKTLSEMTFDQLNTTAKPMPDDAVTNSIISASNYMSLKSQQFIPEDGNIYYISSTYLDHKFASSDNSDITDNTTTIKDYTYYKFLNTDPGRYPLVKYTSYYWEFKNGVLQASGTTTENVPDETLYKQLTGGLTYIPDNYVSAIDSLTPTTAAPTLKHKRLNTMFDIATEVNFGPLDNVVITSGTGFADALSGTVLAGQLKAPIFFMNTTDDDEVYSYINSRLKKGGTVYILGQEGAINSEIENKFTQSGFTVNRIGGTDRYDTSNQINNQLNIAKGTPAIVVSGENFPDALSVSSVAAINGYPILLTEQDTIPEQTISQLNKIKPSKIYVIGGSGSISEDTFNQLKSYSNDVSRIFGSDRYETSMNICKTFNTNNSSKIVLATGEDFKDALAGSVVAAKYSAPMLLINGDTTKVNKYIKIHKYEDLIILGNTNSISSDTENTIIK